MVAGVLKGYSACSLIQISATISLVSSLKAPQYIVPKSFELMQSRIVTPTIFENSQKGRDLIDAKLLRKLEDPMAVELGSDNQLLTPYVSLKENTSSSCSHSRSRKAYASAIFTTLYQENHITGMSTFVEKEATPWDQTQSKLPQPQKPIFRFTHIHLKNYRAIESLPDKGKKLIESNALIREAIRFKTKQPKQGPVRRKSPDKASIPPHLGTLDSQLQKLTLSASSLGSSGTSSSDRQSLSSVASDASPGKSRTGPPRQSLQGNSAMSLREALKMRHEEEMRVKEQELRFQAERARSGSHHIRHHPYYDFVEDDSDDFDGFSEDEYL
ncbi:hypothetical protein DSO57_1023172 [Entomophthora muscae]|uniref:Uncharacterized protein n=1 Tax=Entomophthora muscae TaxID=34485 RepID=A0ACC2SFP4_9FUNG|nr:hypothetical protein DSO57_1023172 [Entomophthora muscae]